MPDAPSNDGDRGPDPRFGHGYGSAWHLLRCLGWHRDSFSRNVARQIGADSVIWRDFPFASSGWRYSSGAPIRDAEWTRLNFIHDAGVQRAYDAFWPTRGSQQAWDAIGVARHQGSDEVLLVEAKAHIGEIADAACGAAEQGGRPQIRQAFVSTLKALGYGDDAAKEVANTWLTRYYQTANRIATLHFLNGAGVKTRLVFLYFCGDRHPSGVTGPVDESGWAAALGRVKNTLGLDAPALPGHNELAQRIHNVFIDVDKP